MWVTKLIFLINSQVDKKDLNVRVIIKKRIFLDVHLIQRHQDYKNSQQQYRFLFLDFFFCPMDRPRHLHGNANKSKRFQLHFRQEQHVTPCCITPGLQIRAGSWRSSPGFSARFRRLLSLLREPVQRRCLSGLNLGSTKI